MKIYKLAFHVQAKREWDKLDGSIKTQFVKHLEKRLKCPHIPSALLSKDLEGCYKIKLRTSGYRLVYEVQDHIVTIVVVAVGRRDKDQAYAMAAQRIVSKISKK